MSANLVMGFLRIKNIFYNQIVVMVKKLCE